LKVVLVTNGYIKEEPLDKLLPYVDAMNIDLKSFNESYYKNLCGGSLKPILKTIKKAAEVCHVEITTLLVSGKNDNLKEVEDISKFLSSIDNNIPLHLSRYFPRYKLKNPPTDINFMKKAEAVGRKYLNRVILGNIY
jgi:pyruvate formate lyase activating enzyme